MLPTTTPPAKTMLPSAKRTTAGAPAPERHEHGPHHHDDVAAQVEPGGPEPRCQPGGRGCPHQRADALGGDQHADGAGRQAQLAHEVEREERQLGAAHEVDDGGVPHARPHHRVPGDVGVALADHRAHAGPGVGPLDLRGGRLRRRTADTT